jgi:hypothetical protein
LTLALAGGAVGTGIAVGGLGATVGWGALVAGFAVGGTAVAATIAVAETAVGGRVGWLVGGKITGARVGWLVGGKITGARVGSTVGDGEGTSVGRSVGVGGSDVAACPTLVELVGFVLTVDVPAPGWVACVVSVPIALVGCAPMIDPLGRNSVCKPTNR